MNWFWRVCEWRRAGKRAGLHFQLSAFHIQRQVRATADLMKAPAEPLKDTEILGKSTRYQVVRADASDLRGWMQDGPVCPLLAACRAYKLRSTAQ